MGLPDFSDLWRFCRILCAFGGFRVRVDGVEDVGDFVLREFEFRHMLLRG